MSEPSPLAGLTAEQADERIDGYKAVVERAEEDLKAKKAHLAEMKRARKSLEEPTPLDAQGNGAVAQAQAAEIPVEGGDL